MASAWQAGTLLIWLCHPLRDTYKARVFLNDLPAKRDGNITVLIIRHVDTCCIVLQGSIWGWGVDMFFSIKPRAFQWSTWACVNLMQLQDSLNLHAPKQIFCSSSGYERYVSTSSPDNSLLIMFPWFSSRRMIPPLLTATIDRWRDAGELCGKAREDSRRPLPREFRCLGFPALRQGWTAWDRGYNKVILYKVVTSCVTSKYVF